MASQITGVSIICSTDRAKETSKLSVTGLCAGNSPVTGEFPAQKASNAENVSISWRHHDISDSPQLNCGSRWSAKIGSKNIRISCRGQMHPAPKTTAWSFGKPPNRTILTSGESYGNLSVQETVGVTKCYILWFSLQWHHNGHDGVSNHQPHHCLLNRSFGRRSKNTSKFRTTGLCDRLIPRTNGQ